jgi:hypothetical protein
MGMIWRHAIIAGAAALYLVALGFFGGVTVERIRYDVKRAAVLKRYEQAARDVRATSIAIEREVGERPAGAR